MITSIDLIMIVIFIITLNIFVSVGYIKTKCNKEKFTVSDAQDFHNYPELRNQVTKKTDNFDKQNLENPNSNSTVDYDTDASKQQDYSIQVSYGREPIKEEKETKTFMTPSDFGWDTPRQAIGCSNSSIANRFKTGDHPLVPYQVACSGPNKLTAENYYKTQYRAQSIPIEDYHIRGYNYQDFASFAPPTQWSKLKILSQNTKGLSEEAMKTKNIPTGANYAFHGTPALPIA